MSYYKADRRERKNRRKAIVITAFLYLGAFAFFIVKDDINWKEYIPFMDEIATEKTNTEAESVASSAEIRP